MAAQVKNAIKMVETKDGKTVLKVHGFPIVLTEEEEKEFQFGTASCESMWVELVTSTNHGGTGILMNNPVSSLFTHGQMVGFVFTVDNGMRYPVYYPVAQDDDKPLFTPGAEGERPQE